MKKVKDLKSLEKFSKLYKDYKILNFESGDIKKEDFTNNTKLKPATKKANQLGSDKLYKTLLKNLKYEETRNYLKKVWARKDKYSDIG